MTVTDIHRTGMELARRVCCCQPVGTLRLCMRRPGHGGGCLPLPRTWPVAGAA